MKAELFSKAMGQIDDKYLMEAVEYKPSNKKTGTTVLRRVAGFLIVCMAGISLFVAFNSEARAAITGWLRQFHSDDWYMYSFEGETDKTAITEEIGYCPGWLPEGCEFVDNFEIMGGETYIYSSKNDMLIQFSYTSDPDALWYVDGVEYEKQEVKVNGRPGEIYIAQSEAQTSSIFWTDKDGHTLFSFSADCQPEELIRFAEEIKIKE